MVDVEYLGVGEVDTVVVGDVGNQIVMATANNGGTLLGTLAARTSVLQF